MLSCLNKRMGASSILEIKTYKQGNVTFTLAPKRVIVQTPLQTFYLTPKASYWHQKVNLVRVMIQIGEIRNLSELASFCGDKVQWRATSLSLEQLIYGRDLWQKSTKQK